MIGSVMLLATLALSSAPFVAAIAPPCWIRGTPERLPARTSALDSTSAVVGGDTIKVCYSRPSARGREIMGGLVPYGTPWRLGANEATSIHVPFAASIAGIAVEPGSYSLYTIPGAQEWTIAVNRGVQRWGIPIDSSVTVQDVGRGTVRAERLETPVETLTLALEPRGAGGADLVISWERTRVRVPIERRGG